MAVHVFVTSKGYIVFASQSSLSLIIRDLKGLFCLRSGVNTAEALNFVLVSTSG